MNLSQIKKYSKIAIPLAIILVVALIIVFWQRSSPSSIKQRAFTSLPTPTQIPPTGEAFKNEFSDPQNRFIINAFPQKKLYRITITKSPFETNRQLAESKFLEITGLNQQQACSEQVLVGTLAKINPEQAGIDFSLSFCQ